MDDCLRKRNHVTFLGDIISLEITHCIKEGRIKGFSVPYFPMNAELCGSLLFKNVSGCSPASLLKETPVQTP